MSGCNDGCCAPPKKAPPWRRRALTTTTRTRCRPRSRARFPRGPCSGSPSRPGLCSASPLAVMAATTPTPSALSRRRRCGAAPRAVDRARRWHRLHERDRRGLRRVALNACLGQAWCGAGKVHACRRCLQWARCRRPAGRLGGGVRCLSRRRETHGDEFVDLSDVNSTRQLAQRFRARPSIPSCSAPAWWKVAPRPSRGTSQEEVLPRMAWVNFLGHAVLSRSWRPCPCKSSARRRQ